MRGWVLCGYHGSHLTEGSGLLCCTNVQHCMSNLIVLRLTHHRSHTHAHTHTYTHTLITHTHTHTHTDNAHTRVRHAHARTPPRTDTHHAHSASHQHSPGSHRVGAVHGLGAVGGVGGQRLRRAGPLLARRCTAAVCSHTLTARSTTASG